MRSPIPQDQQLLLEASCELKETEARCGLEASSEVRLRLLEGAASQIGRYSLEEFDLTVSGANAPVLLPAEATYAYTTKLSEAILASPLHPSLALAVLGDSELDPLTRHRQGHYFTDSRLALNLTSQLSKSPNEVKSILDPACGSGILLVAAALQLGSDPTELAHIARHTLWGVDRDPLAIRAARAAISSLASDLKVAAAVSRRLYVRDSLIAGEAWWRNRSPTGFDLVVGNPPWERLRVTRHEHVLGLGQRRHYGEQFLHSEVDEDALCSDRISISKYRDRINEQLDFQAKGEPDLYRMFVELGARLTSDSGTLAFLVPAGFIRNYGTQELREWLFENFNVDILILDNRDRYFEIDSRFKFIRLMATRRHSTDQSVRFSNSSSRIEAGPWHVNLTLSEFRSVQPDLTIPEVHDHKDWDLFRRLRRAHPEFGSVVGGWHPRFCREVDMTSDRAKFKSALTKRSGIPLIEGRMVHQHRVSAKRYVAGQGRRAEWSVQSPFDSYLQPQWVMELEDIRPSLTERINRTRAGFCDITGQTNERTVLAALIPDGVVCGNKVPTLDFSSDSQGAAWVGIANSIPFDWVTRRLTTTTLNFFILKSLPIPIWDPEEKAFWEIGKMSHTLANFEGNGGQGDLWSLAKIRARIEVLCAKLYGISVSDLDQMMRDFPQLDREQPPIQGESSSTITRDTIVASGQGWATQSQIDDAIARKQLGRTAGAVPFIPNQHARAYRRKL